MLREPGTVVPVFTLGKVMIRCTPDVRRSCSTSEAFCTMLTVFPPYTISVSVKMKFGLICLYLSRIPCSMLSVLVYEKHDKAHLSTHVSCSTREYCPYTGSCKSYYHRSDGVGDDGYDDSRLTVSAENSQGILLTRNPISNPQSIRAHCGCHFAHHFS